MLEKQRACRALWEQWLCPAGFMAHLPEELGFPSSAVARGSRVSAAAR
jgi:hypothetical protein